MNELIIGSKLQKGKYEITKVLGSGNFGITYLATTTVAVNGHLGQMNATVNVAIKEFYMKDLNNRTSDGTTVEGTQNTMVKNYRQKFKKEAENLAKLHHPNIVKVIEIFDENNTTYYVMEYIEGGSLDDYIKFKKCLTEEEALKCTLEIGNALSYMHKNRMIHLDLKPKNIMRDKKGHLYLIDFGLSKQYDENGEPESSTSIGLGTPGYAPLEQANYKQDGTLPVTLDVYALGASLFKMLTGKTPPESSTLLNDGFPIADLQRVGITDNTIRILKKAMADTKKSRYQTVTDLINAISNSVKHNKENDEHNDDDTLYDNNYHEDISRQIVSSSLNQEMNVNQNDQKQEKISSGTKTKILKIVKKCIIAFMFFVIILISLTCLNNMPLGLEYRVGYWHLGDEHSSYLLRNWNYGLYGIIGSVLCLAVCIFWKKKIVAYFALVGIIISVLFMAVFLRSEISEYQEVANMINNDEFKEVDLGLPSGTLWSDRNLGAKKTTSDGYNYYYNSEKDEWSRLNCTKIDSTLVGTESNIVHTQLGNGWQLPSAEQFEELIRLCSFYWEGKGYKIVGPNGNSMFFPCNHEEYGLCWLLTESKGKVFYLNKGHSQIDEKVEYVDISDIWYSYDRLYSIRPVKKQ